MFQLGRRIDVRWLLRERWLLLTALLSAGVIFVALVFGLSALGWPRDVAWLAATLGIATSPAVLMFVVRELRAEGQVSERALNLAALNNALAFIAFTLVMSLLHLERQNTLSWLLLQPLLQCVGAALLGMAGGWLAAAIGRWLGPHDSNQVLLHFAMIVLLVGMADWLALPALITLLAMGVVSRHLDHHFSLLDSHFAPLDRLFYVLLFVYAGAILDLSVLKTAWLGALLFIALRALAQFSVPCLLARCNGMPFKQGALLGIALLPMSGVWLSWALLSCVAYPELAQVLTALMMGSLIISELLGPIIARWALIRAGEAHTPPEA